MTKNDAVQSAGAKLDQLNDTMRRVMILNAAMAGMLAILTALACYTTFEYVRLKMAMNQMAAGMDRSFTPKPKAPIVTKQGLRSPG